MNDARDAARIYLIADAGPHLGERLATALDAAPIASVLIRPGATPDVSSLKSCVEVIQARGVATLIAGDAALARTLRADGVHLPAGSDIGARYGEARDVLGTRYIVGVEAGSSRHDAMELGEAGADYVAFGASETGAAIDDETLDLVDWWSEIFEVPCIGFTAVSPDDALALAEAGADFVAVRLPAGTSAGDIRDALKAIDDALAVPATAA